MNQEDIISMMDTSRLQEMRDHPLDEELALYLEDGTATSSGMNMIRHPLVYEVPYFGLAGLANARLRSKREMLATALESGNISSAIWLHERPWRLSAFLQYAVDIDPTYESPDECETLWEMSEEVQQMALHVWSDSENVEHYHQWWIALFSPDSPSRKQLPDGSRQVLVDEEGARILSSLPEEFAVFRGGERRDGLSWTLDMETAERFSGRWAREGAKRLTSRRVKLSEVFAIIGDRGESELLLLP